MRVNVFIKTATQSMALCLAAIALLCGACNKEKEKNDSALLAGTWTSVSATGTVNFTDQTLTNTVNAKMNAYDLTDMVILEFEKDGASVSSGRMLFFGLYRYAFKDQILELTSIDGPMDYPYKLEMNGNEMTLTHNDLFVGKILELVAQNIGYAEVEGSGVGAGAGLTSVNLTVKFLKQ